MRYIHFDVSNKESYSLDSVGKHGFGGFLKDIYPKLEVVNSKELSISHLP